MRFPLAVAVVAVGISASGLGQHSGTSGTYKVKPSASEKAPKRSAPIGKTAGSTTASAANAKELQSIEHQSGKIAAPPKAAGTKAPGKASALKPVKDKPNPPINFSGTGAKTTRTANQSSNPYKGRLRQKHAHQ